MSQTGLPAFDSTLHATNTWLKDLMEDQGWDDRQRAYHALRAVLHCLRDRLPIDAVAHLGAQLPMLVRGVYYEGWHPAGKPLKQHRQAFLDHIAQAFHDGPRPGPETIARAVFRVLARHVSTGEVESVKRSLPEDLRVLWPW